MFCSIDFCTLPQTTMHSTTFGCYIWAAKVSGLFIFVLPVDTFWWASFERSHNNYSGTPCAMHGIAIDLTQSIRIRHFWRPSCQSKVTYRLYLLMRRLPSCLLVLQQLQNPCYRCYCYRYCLPSLLRYPNPLVAFLSLLLPIFPSFHPIPFEQIERFITTVLLNLQSLSYQ